jgi:Putative Actinobacterial Holin-X, holin superfamily III
MELAGLLESCLARWNPFRSAALHASPKTATACETRSMDASPPSRSLNSLFTALSRQLSALFRRELALARAELSEKVREAGSGLALLALGGMIILTGLFFIVQAVVFGVVALLDLWLLAEVAVWLGPLLVGLAAVLIGWALLSNGRKS